MPDKKIVNIRDFQDRTLSVYFAKEEMNAMLAVYGARVAKGQWCDYAIEQRNGIIAFSVFNNAHDAPEYTIAKCSRPPRGGEGRFLLLSGPQKLIQTDNLSEVLDLIRLKPEQAARGRFIELVKA